MANIRQLITTGTSSGKGEAIKSGSGVLNQAITLLNQVENRLRTTEGGLNVLVGVPGLIDDIFSQLEVLEDQISLTVSSAEITKLTQTYDNQAVSQIAVEPTVIDLAPGDILKIGNLDDLENPFTFEVSGSTVIAAGSETIPIQPVDGTGTVTITAASGAAVVLDGFSLLTKIQLLKDEIILKASQTSVDAITGDLESLQSQITILSDQIALVTQQGSAVELGVTAAAYTGTISSITLVDPIPIDLPLGSLLILDNAQKTEVYTTANYLAANDVTVIGIATEGGGAVTLPGTLASGSSVFLAGNLLLAKIQLLADAITSTVLNFSQINSICTLTTNIVKNVAINQISVSPLTTPLEVGDQLIIYNKSNLDVWPVTVSVAKEPTSVNTTISITSTTPTVDIPSGSGVHVRESYAFSKIKQTKDSVTTQVERFSLAGSLGTLTANYNESRSTLAITALPYDVKSGERFYIINKTTGVSIPIVLTQNANAGTNQLTISSTFVNAPLGSGVHVDTALMRSTLTQTANSITSTVESVSTAGSFTTLSATYNGANTTLAVNALPSALVAGQKLYIINRATGLTYPIVLAQNAAANATSITITQATVIATSGSGVHLDVSDYRSVITQTANAITLDASKLYGALYVANMSLVGYTPNSDNIIFPNGSAIAVPSGSTLIINGGTNKNQFFTFVTTSNLNAGATAVFVQPQNVTVPVGSDIYLAPSQSSGRIKVLTDQVSLSVTRTALRSYLNGSYVAYVSSNPIGQKYLVTVLPFFIQLFKGDVIRLLPDPSLGQTEVTDPPIELTVDTVQTFPGSGQIYTVETLNRNVAGMLIYLERAGDTRIGSQFSVYADSIQVDTPILKSYNYNVSNGTGWAIKGNGSADFFNITARGTLQSSNYTQGSQGWRINNNGSAEFNDVTVRGYVTTTGLGNAIDTEVTSINGGKISASSRVTVGTNNDVAILNGSGLDPDWRIWAGNATPTSAPFRVSKSGAVTATDATITGSFTSQGGAAGFVTLNGTDGIRVQFQGGAFSDTHQHDLDENGLSLFRDNGAGITKSITINASPLSTDLVRMIRNFVDVFRIKTDGPTIMELSSTVGGALLPRMTSTQRNAISSPPNGLIVYNTTLGRYETRVGSNWIQMSIPSGTTSTRISNTFGVRSVFFDETTDSLWVNTQADGWKELAFVS